MQVPAEEHNRPSVAWSDTTESIPIGSEEYVTSTPLPDPDEFEKLRAQLEHAEMECAEMASTLRVSQASEVALQKQLKDSQTRLRRANDPVGKVG
jgi:hypothetical protein